MYESVLRARSSNQRSHRSPRHAVARALTHQASPASIRAQGFSLLTGAGAAGPARCPVNPRVATMFRAGVVGATGSRDGWLAALLSGSGGLFCRLGRLEGDGEAERFELALQPTGAVLDGVALALPVGSEVAEGDLVANDVVVGDEQVVADRADRFLFAATPTELGVVRGEVGLFGAYRSAGALGQLRGQPTRSRPSSTRFAVAG